MFVNIRMVRSFYAFNTGYHSWELIDIYFSLGTNLVFGYLSYGI